MDLTIIAAVSENNVVGINGKIPWRIKEDIIRFKELTLNHPVIMGRKTYESIPGKFRPLPRRKNVVLSRNFKTDEKIYVVGSIKEALEFVKQENSYVIGGEQIYKAFLPYANKMELTRVFEIYEGDCFFPHVNWDEWKGVDRSHNREENGIKYAFLSYVRK